MSVDSLISIEPVHTHRMYTQIQNILSEGVVREDRNANKNGPPSAHQRNAIEMSIMAHQLNTGLIALCIWGSGSILLGTLYFCDFSGGGGGGVRTPCPPLDPPMACI